MSSISAIGGLNQAFASRHAASADDTSNAEAFAGMLSGAMQSHEAARAPTPSRKDGTSELDRPDRDDDSENSSVSESKEASDKKRAHRHTAAAPEVVRSVEALDPELQAKLARVVARMKEETGKDVDVSETYRSQARQDTLFAQGRETDGPVVTWTQNSKHTQGRAVDVTIDQPGGDAYSILQRIANEEGLRTLGAKDPGHLELRGNGAKASSEATPNIPAEPADATGPGQVSIARLAQVARVAEVKTERPAPVARVAAVATPGAAALARAANAKGSSSSHDSGAQTGGDSRGGYAAFTTPAAHRDSSSFTTATVAPTTGADAVARAERVMEAMDSAAPRSLSQITMNVDAGNGQTDRVHVALRGSALNAQIDTGDTRAAQLLSAKSDELSRALSRDGIELRELRVRASDTSVAAATASQSSNNSANAETASRFDRGDAWQQRRDQQDQQDRQRDQQQRSASRQSQRDKRGGR